MTEGNQRTLSGFEEARAVDENNSKYWKPATNKTYELTFGAVKDSPDQNHPHYKLLEKDIPDFKDKSKMTKKVVLVLQLDNKDGKPVSQEWSILAMKLIKQFELPCKSGSIAKKRFILSVEGEGKEKTYSLVEKGDR